MSYLDFLRSLLALGPKLPDIFEQVQIIVSAYQRIVALVTGKEPLFGAGPMELNTKEQAAEDEVYAAMEASGNETFAARDRGALRDIFDFIKNNPDLLKFIIALFAK